MLTTERTALMRGKGVGDVLSYIDRNPVDVRGGYDAAEQVGYSPAPFLSICSMCINVPGAMFSSWIIWIEQFAIYLVCLIACCWYSYYEGTQSKESWVAKAEAEMLTCVGLLATLCAFLIGFFLSLNVARWWRLRTEGVGNIWSASSQLSLFLSEMVTKDPRIISAVSRYARASLMMVFMRRRGYLDQLELLVEREILTEDEVQQLKAYNNNLAESIWAWNAHIIGMLYRAGKFRSENQVVYAYELVNKGRAGAALICAQMNTPIPASYTHMVGVIVTVHNILLAIVCGHMLADCIRDSEKTRAFFIIVRLNVQSCIFFALLKLNENLMDPFKGGTGVGFPLKKYCDVVGTDAASYVNAGELLPGWMHARDTAEPTGHRLEDKDATAKFADAPV